MNYEILKKTLRGTTLWVINAPLVLCVIVSVIILGYVDWRVFLMVAIGMIINFILAYIFTRSDEKITTEYNRIINKALENLEKNKALEDLAEEIEKEAEKMCQTYKKNKDGNNEN